MPSPEYRRALAATIAHHALHSKTYSGKFLRPHKPYLVGIIAENDLASVLDYGCGKGRQYEWRDPGDGLTIEEACGITFAKYDPGVSRFSKEPTGLFDLVVCTHVLGSVPVVDLPWFLTRLFGHAGRIVYIAERLGPVKKDVLPNPDAHPVGWSAKQWRDAIAPHVPPGVTLFLMTREKGTGGTVWHRHTYASGAWNTERVK